MRLVLLASVSFFLTFQAYAAEKEKLFVPDLVAERGVDESLVRLLNELLLTRFLQTGRYDVLGSTDIDDLLEHEQLKQLTGCESTSCLAEIGGALGVAYVARASLGRVGDYYLLNVKLLDVRTAKVLSRWSEQVEALENTLVQALVRSVNVVTDTGQDEKSTAASPQAAPTVEPGREIAAVPAQSEGGATPGDPGVTESAGSPVMSIMPWILVAAGAVAAATGVAFAVDASSNADRAQQIAVNSPDYTLDDFQGAAGAADTGTAVAATMFGVAVVAGGAATALWLIGGEDEEPVDTTTTVGAVPLRDGAAVFVGFTF